MEIDISDLVSYDQTPKRNASNESQTMQDTPILKGSGLNILKEDQESAVNLNSDSNVSMDSIHIDMESFQCEIEAKSINKIDHD